MFSIDGLVSGLDTASIIEGLVSLQESQVDRLNVRKNRVLTQQTAFQGIEARVLSLRATMSQLNRTTSSVFEKSFATTSDESLVTVKAGNNAAEGSYNIRVISMARAHQIGSQGFDSNSTSTSQGTISFQVGDRPATTVTIDGSNNTITGLVDAINVQSSDVSASIIHDQANNADRILLTSKHTGASNDITVNNNLAAATGNLVRPDFTGLAIQEATNAAIQLGSGPGAITAEYETNSVDGLIENITLDLVSIDANQDVTINVSRDTESAKEAIEDFVDEYNSLISYIDEQTKYNAETNVASPLNGNRNVSTLKNRLGAMVTETVPGLDTRLNRFSQIGVEIDAKGRLTIDSAKLDNALEGGIEGVKLNDVKRLFGLDGTSTTSGIEFILGSSRTKASTTPYEVDILQVAERASVVATNSLLAKTTVIEGKNQEFQISVDGQESEVLTLTAGTYFRQELADHLQSLINASTTLANRDVVVSLENDALQITSSRYGLSSEIANISGSAISVLGFDGSETDLGQDVAGSFIVNGIVETATGTGRVLAGDSENENTADLQIRVTLDATQIGAGSEGEISVTRGIVSRLDQYFGDLLDPTNGTIKVANDAFESRVESLESSIERVNAISEAKSLFLIEQFTQLERILSELQTTSGFLSSQLTG